MGDRERCMYCLDSLGTDIEHFRPKTSYPDRMFVWSNLLLCCTACGRWKLDRFPLSKNGEPLLIDPTAEDPWVDLDFEPSTGMLVPRFLPNQNLDSERGTTTIRILHLNREALATGYRRTFLHLSKLVREAISNEGSSVETLFDSLSSADDHGLLGWCLLNNGQYEPPFSELRTLQPERWRRLCHLIENGS